MYKAQLLLKVIFPWSAQAHGGDSHGSGKGCMLFTSHLLQDGIILQQRTIQKGSILLSHQLGCLLKDAKKKGERKMGWILKNEYPFIMDSFWPILYTNIF